MTQSGVQEIIKVDILDYLGKYDGGVLALISIQYEDNYYDATFFYTQEMLVLTPDEKLEEKLGCQIEDWVDYKKLMLIIISKVVPFDDIINIVDDFEPEKWELFLDKK
jgi:hypothetical protein